VCGIADLVEDAGDDEIDDILHGFWVMVEAGAGRQDDGAGARQAQHVFEMDGREGRFTWNQHQFAAFLEHDVGGAFDQLVGQALGDGGQVPIEQGQMTIASGGLEPEATGANHSSRPKNGSFSGSTAG
jgi:hypothetical protein